ncbi:MAG: GDP-mannose 4,6-dehydratase [Candidatus Shapirobacteria bacterium GW2011_GWE1_38_10]|uniref:GDP-mannose 4,6-dehydratase n=1 Tax=Candidatus Shapirobacteria bacterium GW2011_GWE1_38_10 TaxID=1618488 RepID=A0A0G0L797_9BACT|nr:MAG: GDP-mannose 4,6-dehydratase [Candidatus Shapirobacteria bacterium GW2011_GWF2_37_20]KKQ48531.1 MAG: GDP-mannose 4,6-dehydratase [Candidatus Shapirobacteria bacterium GW2011_GWE1_38_10]KKQ64569.1 MAG: GDP-mannose 4,6-dehydratase [Candidatus Shapirobacteria bacterium GW2011_GWF1_38_23]
MKIKKALITGITGQDGSYLAELLLKKNYEVHGIIRRTSNFNTSRIDHLFQNPKIKDHTLFLHYGDLAEPTVLDRLIREIQPNEIYNLAAQTHVKVSFEIPEYTADVVGLGVIRILEAIKNYCPSTKFFQASSSEMFGKVLESPQDENTPFYPRSPYGCAKVFAYWITKNYRESYNLFASNGIFFNHESPRRGKTFVTRKITRAVANIKLGKQDKLYLGNLDAKRDWGYARDFVKAMWLMLQQPKPDDFVVATGKTHSVREFAVLAFKEAGIDIVWKGKKEKEQGIDKKTGKTLIEIDPEYFRPAEVDFLQGNPRKANKILKWKSKTSFEELVSLMVKFDLENEAKVNGWVNY